MGGTYGMMQKIKKFFYNVETKLYNSKFWFWVYYSHTKKHQQECEDVLNGVLEIRKRVIGR
jgi:hypothetical protein